MTPTDAYWFSWWELTSKRAQVDEDDDEEESSPSPAGTLAATRHPEQVPESAASAAK